MTMRLHHNPLSSSARRAVMTAKHLGLNVEYVVRDLTSPADRASLVKLNPNNKVPVLEDGDLVLWESHAIMQYLADKTAGQSLYPTDLRARAEVNRWMFWGNSEWYPAIGILNFEHFVKAMIGAGPTDPQQVKRGEEMFHKSAKVLDAHLAGREWMCGAGVTLADYGLASGLMTRERARMPVAPYTNILTWFDRVRALDAWKQTDL
jgi:glutathione S-transferase